MSAIHVPDQEKKVNPKVKIKILILETKDKERYLNFLRSEDPISQEVFDLILLNEGIKEDSPFLLASQDHAVRTHLEELQKIIETKFNLKNCDTFSNKTTQYRAVGCTQKFFLGILSNSFRFEFHYPE